MKKILYTLFILILILTTFSFADANKEYTDNAVITLNKMKIIIGNENGDLMLDKNLTRAEFATIVVRLLGIENTKPIENKITFTDFDNTFWGYTNIYNCVSKGYLIGDGDGRFRPNDVIKYEEACTILIRILGKDEGLVTWPDDYLSKTEELGINKYTTLKKSDSIDRKSACVLIYNCLNIKL